MSVNKVNSDGSLLRVAGGTLYADAPIGTISPFGGSVVPSGYLLCNGAEVLKTAYAELYAVIGDVFGTASDNTKFVLPDLRETVPVGSGTRGSGVTSHDTYDVGEFKDDQLQSHTHSLNIQASSSIRSSSSSSSVETGGSVLSNVGYARNNIGSQWDLPFSLTVNGTSNASSGRSGTTTHGKQLGVNYIIKAKQVAVPFDMAEYIRNQNVLSEYENITLPVSSVPYDGLLTVSVSNGGYVSFSINSRNFTIGSASGTSDTSEITFKKGNNVGFLEAGGTYSLYIRYYKLRDYSGR